MERTGQFAFGFRPAEISALINEPVVAQHASEAPFLWSLRDRAVGAPQYSLDQIATLDRRVEAHLAGLYAADEVGQRLVREELVAGRPGSLFAFCVLACRRRDSPAMKHALVLASESPTPFRELVSALGWCSTAVADAAISNLLASTEHTYVSLGIAACGVRRKDPGSRLSEWCTHDNSWLRSRALRTAGLLKRGNCLRAILDQLTAAEPACRFAAANAAALLGSRSAVTPLLELSGVAGRFQRSACVLLLYISCQ